MIKEALAIIRVCVRRDVSDSSKQEKSTLFQSKKDESIKPASPYGWGY